MGRMESKSTIGVKYYDVLSKKTFGDIAALDRRLPLYSFENQGGRVFAKHILTRLENFLQEQG